MHSKAGFSLVQLAIVLTIAALMVASTLPGGEFGSEAEKTRITLERMAKIEKATEGFMAQYKRRPYPADITLAFNDGDYGKEHNGVTADYTDGDVVNNFSEINMDVLGSLPAPSSSIEISDTSLVKPEWLLSGEDIESNTQVLSVVNSTVLNISAYARITGETDVYMRNPLIAGGVPTKTLGLPDEIGIDGWGRRMVYMVDLRANDDDRCASLQNFGKKGYLSISSSSNFDTGTFDNTMWALMSYGKDGQGALGMQVPDNDVLNNRIKTGNTDADTLENAFYDSSQDFNYDNVRGLVKKEATSTFDDIVWYAEKTKNTCSLGKDDDFAINASTTGTGDISVAFGDVNGDGQQDMILGASQLNLVRVIFGGRTNWPSPATVFQTSSGLDGLTGFTINKSTANIDNFGTQVLSGDMNGDGYDDIIIAGNPSISASGHPGYTVIFGKAIWTSSINVSSLSVNEGLTISGLNEAYTGRAALGDINGDGNKDLLIENTSSIYTILGQSSYSSVNINTASFNGADGFIFNTLATFGSGYIYGNANTTDGLRKSFAVCDVDADGIDDLVFPGMISAPLRYFLVAGRSLWSYTGTPAIVDTNAIDRQLVFSDALSYYKSDLVFCHDINNDGYDDIIMNLYGNDMGTIYNYYYVYYGSSTINSSSSDINIYTNPYNRNDLPYFRFDLISGSNQPVWRNDGFEYAAQLSFGDINGDGKDDIILSRMFDGPNFPIDDASGTGSRTTAGIIYAMFQPDDSIWAADGSTVNVYDQTYDGVSGVKLAGARDSENIIGWGVADFNQDNIDDIIIRYQRPSATDGGAYLVHGKRNWNKLTNIGQYDLNCLRDTSESWCATQNNLR